MRFRWWACCWPATACAPSQAIASGASVRGGAGGSAYVAAKHGIEGMVKSVAAEGRPHRITANSVGPGCALAPTGATRDQVRSDDHGAGGGGLTDAELARLFPMGTAERKRWTDPAMLAP
eukprot:COSAG01_NODE_35107_length_536_cov_439.736842_1_plen_119_part_10